MQGVALKPHAGFVRGIGAEVRVMGVFVALAHLAAKVVESLLILVKRNELDVFWKPASISGITETAVVVVKSQLGRFEHTCLLGSCERHNGSEDNDP
jgi:hypothetical protein